MNGKQAAQAVADHCREMRHETSRVNPKEPVLCERYREIMARLEKLGAEERPPLSTVTVHFVLRGDGHFVYTLDEAEANSLARDTKGMVVSWPVSADYRETES
jgi:hypothetical protein